MSDIVRWLPLIINIIGVYFTIKGAIKNNEKLRSIGSLMILVALILIILR